MVAKWYWVFLCAVGEECIVIVGGLSLHNRIYDDLYIIYINGWKIKKVMLF